MAWITLAIAPVLILLVFEFQFLPYHSRPVTWAVRVLIVIDLAIVLVIWPAVRDPGRDVTLGRLFRQWVALSTAIGNSRVCVGRPHVSRGAARGVDPVLAGRKGAIDRAPAWKRSRVPNAKSSFLVAPSFDRLNLPLVNVVGNDNLEKTKEHTRAAGEPDSMVNGDDRSVAATSIASI